MSTNGRSSGGGSDGFGGDGIVLAPADGEEILEDPAFSPGEEFEIDPDLLEGGGAGAAAPDQRQAADPWAGFDDDARELAKQKGWNTPADMAKAYRNAEGLIGSRDTEAERRARAAEAQLQQVLATIGQSQQAPQQQQGPQTLDEIFAPIDYDELERVAQGDPRTMLAIYHEQVAGPQMKAALARVAEEILGGVDQSVGQRLAPVEQFTARSTVREQVQTLARDYGQMFTKHQAELERVLTSNPDLVRQPNGVTRAFNDLVARDVLEQQRQSRAQEGETLLGGRARPAGGTKPVDIDKMIREEIEGAGGFVRDGLG